MIEINLLPEEFRIAEKVEKKEVPLLKIGIGVAVMLAIVTVSFYFDYIGSSKKMKKVNATWLEVQPQSQILNNLKQEVEEVLKTERDFLAQFVTTERPLTFTLEWLSSYLPEAAWLTHTALEHKKDSVSLVVQGLCVSSKTMTSIEAIEKYLHDLKQKMPEAKLSLTTARQFEDDIEMTRFTAIFEWTFEKEEVAA